MLNRKPQYHNSFYTIPILLFDRLSRGDVGALVISGKPKLEKLIEARYRIMDERLKEFGVADTFLQATLLQERAAELRAKAWLKGDKFQLNKAKLLDAQANELLGETTDQKFSKTLAMACQKAGFRIDPNTVTAFEFFSIIYN